MHSAYQTVVHSRDNELWNALSTKTIAEASCAFLKTLSFHTQRSYKCGFNTIFRLLHERSMLDASATLQTFALCNMENLLDCIKTHLIGSEGTKQSRCGVFISFTRYLERASQGMIRCAKPITGTFTSTFKKIRNKAHTKALTPEQWTLFIRALRQINRRDALIAKALFQGAKRISEVLECTIDKIEWEKNQISFKQAKSSLLTSITCINYSTEFMNELKDYLDGREEGFIFVTRNGKAVVQPHVHRNFAYASVKANLPCRVHPHMLRATAITWLMGMGHHSDQIMKVSGHSSPQAVLYYDKSELEDNPTKHTKLC